LHASYQRNLIEQDHMHMLSSQLLLEKSTWMVPARIQHIAENSLKMVVPTHDAIVIIRGTV
jgi:cell division protein FtsL